MNKAIFRIVVAASFLMPSIAAAAEEEIHALRSYYDHVASIAISYDQDVEFTPSGGSTPPAVPQLKGLTAVVQRGHLRSSEKFSYVGGDVLFERSFDLASPALAATRADASYIAFESIAFTPGRVEQQRWYDKHSKPLCVIQADFVLPEESIIDVALGLRVFGTSKWDMPARLGGLRPIKVDKEPHLFNLDVITGAATNRWVLDERIGMSPVRFSRFANPGEPIFEIDCSDFQQIGNLSLPSKIAYRSFYKDASNKNICGATGNISKISYNLKSPPIARTKWQPGVAVLDARNNITLAGDPNEWRDWSDSAIVEEVRLKDSEEKTADAALAERLRGASNVGPATSPSK